MNRMLSGLAEHTRNQARPTWHLGSRLSVSRIFLHCLLIVVSAMQLTLSAAPLQVTAERIDVNPLIPEERSFGTLLFLRGFELTSRDRRFGGLSGLALDPTGTRLYAVSDRGYSFSARLVHDAAGQLMDLDAWDIQPLRTPNGGVVTRRQIDAEALVRDQDGTFVIAFEHLHRLWRYPHFAAKPQPLPIPRALTRAPANGGLESVTRLPDGQWLLLTERFTNPDGTHKGWLQTQEQFAPLSYVTAHGYVPTDLAVLANGDVLVLERRYRPLLGVAIRLRRVPGASIRPGTRLQGAILMELTPPLPIDNFEGLAVHDDGQGGTVLYMVSDDNYNLVQRTLLLQFRVLPEAKKSPYTKSRALQRTPTEP